MKPSDILTASETISEAVEGLVDLAAEIAAHSGMSVEEFVELSAHRFAHANGETVKDCSITLVLVEKEAAN